MITFKLNGLEVQAAPGWTILDTAKFYGLEIPTLCYMEGLDPWGGCRLCVVEIGEGPKTKMVSSCTYRVEEGLVVHHPVVPVGQHLFVDGDAEGAPPGHRGRDPVAHALPLRVGHHDDVDSDQRGGDLFDFEKLESGC